MLSLRLQHVDTLALQKERGQHQPAKIHTLHVNSASSMGPSRCSWTGLDCQACFTLHTIPG